MKNIFKFASLLAAAAMLFACKGNSDDPVQNNNGTGNGSGTTNPKAVLKVTADKNIIQTFDGDYATLTVTLDGKAVTEDVTFFDGKKNVIDVPGFKFSTTTPGEHKIIASYGTYISEEISIKAVAVAIPAAPVDPNPDKTDFKPRVLIVEHTGTECGFCPPMKTLVHKALEDKEFADKVVLTTCHTFNSNDPAYFNENDFKEFNGVSGHPYLFFDSYMSFNDYTETPTYFKGQIQSLYDAKKDVASGIAVNSVASDNQVVVKVEVKAAETATYRVGAYLLEDGIEGAQTSATADWMNIHDGCISNVDAKYYAGASVRYFGHSLGQIQKGKTGDYVFVWDLAEIQKARKIGCSRKDFVKENMRLAVFVTTVGEDEKGNEFYYVNNVVECPLNGQKPYEYK